MTAQTTPPGVRVAIIDPPVALPAGMELPAALHQRYVAGPGRVWFRECPIPIWASRTWIPIWQGNKLAFAKRGFSLRQHEGQWYLCQWLCGMPGNYGLTQQGIAALDRLTAPVLPLQLPPPVELVLDPLPNGLEDLLYPYQRPAARQLFRALTHGKEEWGYPGAWDASELGTGKTYESLAAAIATGREVGVICPKAVIGTPPRYGNKGTGWTGAFAHFKQQPLFVLNYESLRTGSRAFCKRNGTQFEWACSAEETLLIFDEAHFLANKSLNRSLAFAAIRQRIPCMMISGTMAQSPLHMGATGVVVGLHDGTRQGYERFLAAHGCIKSGNSWKAPRGRQAAIHLAAIHRKVFPMRGARVRIKDLGDLFPDTQIICEPISTEATDLIAQAWKDAKTAIEKIDAQGGINETQKRMMQNAAYMDAWHNSERAKVSTIVTKAHEELAEGRSVAIFVNFTDVREALMRELKTKCAIFGGQNQFHRDACIADFQADRERVIIANTAAGGVGVSLHDLHGNHPRTAFLLPTNNAVHLGQALGRVHRAGGVSKSRQIVLFAADTVEEQICESTRAKLSNISTLNDGDLCPPSAF